MLETEHEEFEQPDYPSFPVVFQKDLEKEFDEEPVNAKSEAKKTISVNENDAHSLFRLTDIVYQTKYPHLFSKSLEGGGQLQVVNFFKEYLPINQSFVQEMKKNINSLKICRIGNNKVYVGNWVDGKCNGKGILIFKNGNLYEGQMENNKRCGQGVYIHVNQGWYKGNFKDDYKNGEGIQVFYQKSTYKGNFVNGLRHDKGLYIDDENNIYDGIWKLGIMHGKGVLKTSKSIYSGVFVNFLKHGTGQQHFSNGDIYRGQYQNGRFDGIGSYEWKTDKANYEGNFKNGLRHGKGKWQRAETKYSGGYVEGLKEGYGQLYYGSGNFYKGNFIEDKKDGYGEMFWKDSSFYKGQWKKGSQNGKGQIYVLGGDIVSGFFQNNILVQPIPSMYEKQMEISNMNIQDMFGSKPRINNPNKVRTISEQKNITRKKLTKIVQTGQKKKNGHSNAHKNGHSNIHNKLYFRSPQKSEHSDGEHRECTRCMRRLHNFQLNQNKGLHQKGSSHSHSKDHHHHHHYHHH